tara:strand:- start:800 stop:1111 length:312 start_codon:yes stop_codon:yes gene_type:complete
MKNAIFVFIILGLIIFTTLIKNSSKEIDKEIFKLEEDISILKNELEMLKLEHDYLTSPKKLTELQKLYFEEELINYDLSKFGEIIINENELLILKKDKFLSNE